jgi:hypothetical protein
MARDPAPAPDPNAIFRRSAVALAEAFRGLARERKDDPEAVKDLLAAASAIERALTRIG